MEKESDEDGVIVFVEMRFFAKFHPAGLLSVKPCFNSDILSIKLL